MIWLKPLMFSLGIGGGVSLAVYALMDARDGQKDEGSVAKKKDKSKNNEKEMESRTDGGGGLGQINQKKESDYIKKLRLSAQERSSQRTDRILPTGNWRAK
ncbi:hypothetical protein FY034_18165 (plasmid) [Trichlorobacter lovleyi]|uniref:hypothetical protein n=1 Tax=Trichlorobacter lovleyi TaxID=313985 RepID=UPI00223FF94C|nr:hypothetical protein [Trichlorobacter lovleyi]QOX80927.1 hypothetical protein FY034_18165 [Trichlorobacter lovleyi]